MLRELQPFRVDLVPDRARVIVAPSGELDLATCDDLWREIEQLARDGFAHVVLDLRQLTFIDSSGLRMMFRAREAASRDGFDFAVIDGDETACRALDVTGVRGFFAFTRP